MLQVVEINTIEHLEAIRLRWTSLLYKTRGGSFFHTLDWLKIYWRHFGGGQRLRVLLVYRGGTVLGILPLVVRHEMTAAGLGDVLTYPVINASSFLGPIGPNPTATLMASFRHLAGETPGWDLLSLGSIGEHDRGRTSNALELAGFSPYEVVHANVSKIGFDASWRVNHSEQEANTARDLSFERIRPLGRTYGDNESMERIIDECRALDRHSPFAELTPATSLTLIRDVVAAASRLGMLDLNLLRLDDRLTAFSLNVHFDGAIQQIFVGRSAEFFGFNAAALMTSRMLQDSVARNDRYIYLNQAGDGFAKTSAIQQLPVASYQHHRASFPFRTQLSRVGNWLRLR